MFAPTKTFRKWHRKINVHQKRSALCSAIAATGVPALVQAKGHVISDTPEVPLVVADNVQSFSRTKQAVSLLRSLKAWKDVEKVYKTKRLRAGKGKLRNRRKKQKLGPLVVYGKDNGITRAFRNIPGVRLLNVNRMNLLQVAPGGHLGRFTIWTESAFSQLDSIYGTGKVKSTAKVDYNLPHSIMTTTDLSKLLKSQQVQRTIRAPNKSIKRFSVKKNPLKNIRVMMRLNPFSTVVKRSTHRFNLKKRSKRVAATNKKLGIDTENTKESRRLKKSVALKENAKKVRTEKRRPTRKVAHAKRVIKRKAASKAEEGAGKVLAERKAKLATNRAIVKAANKAGSKRKSIAKKTEGDDAAKKTEDVATAKKTEDVAAAKKTKRVAGKKTEGAKKVKRLHKNPTQSTADRKITRSVAAKKLAKSAAAKKFAKSAAAKKDGEDKSPPKKHPKKKLRIKLHPKSVKSFTAQEIVAKITASVARKAKVDKYRAASREHRRKIRVGREARAKRIADARAARIKAKLAKKAAATAK